MEKELRDALLAADVELELAVRRFGGNIDLYEKFLKQFLNDRSYVDLQTALCVGDRNAACQAAHALKGTSANLGLTRLTKASFEAEMLLRDAKSELIQRVPPALEESYFEIVNVLQLSAL